MTGLHFSHLLVTKWRKGQPECAAPRAGAPACGSPPRKRSVGYGEEADGVQRSQAGSLRRCSRGGVRSAG